MTTRSISAALVKMLAVLLTFAFIAAACSDDDDDSGSADVGDDADDVADADDADDEDDAEEAVTGAQVDEEDSDTAAESTGTDEDLGEPVRGGTLRIGVEAETDGLNPTVNRFAVAASQMAHAVLEPLAVYDASGFPTPYLASGWESSDDGMTFTLFLREGIKFSDGTDFNAAAVVRNLEGQLADPLIRLAVAPVFDADNPVEVIDDHTVQYNLALPNKQVAVFLPTQLGLMASPAWLDAADEDDTLNQAPVGTGPFLIDERRLDDFTRFVRNDEWWQTEQLGREVWLDAIEFYINTDSEIGTGQLLANDLESLGTTNPQAIETLRGEADLVRIEDDFGEESFAMMNSTAPPFDDIRVRQAITFATPLQQYLDFVGAGILRPADSMFTPELIWNNPDVVQEGDTPDLAAPLIESYCADVPESCTGGKVDIVLQYSGPSVVQEQVADILIGTWGEFFNVERNVLLQDDHITGVAFGSYQIVTWRQFGAPDPAGDRVWLACDSISALSLNWPRLCDQEREDLLNESRATTDLDTRVAIWKELQQKIHDDYLYIFFNHTLWVNAFQPEVKNQCGALSPDDVEMLCTVNGAHYHAHMWIDPS